MKKLAITLPIICLLIYCSTGCKKEKQPITNNTLPPTITNVTDFDGNIYDTVKIGNQRWLKQNLKVTHFRDGSAVTEMQIDSVWQNNSLFSPPLPACCNVNGSSSNTTKYGKLYNWYAATDPRGLCPTGWHTPSQSDWAVLVDYLGDETNAGGYLKDTSSVWGQPNVGANNSSGFTALPAGVRLNPVYCTFRAGALFWSATTPPSYITSAFTFGLSYFDSGAYNDASDPKVYGHSVRCIGD